MRNLIKPWFILVLSLLCAGLASAADSPEIEAIRQLYTQAQALRQAPATQKIRLVQTLEGEAVSDWHKPKTEEDRSSVVQEATVYRTAAGISSAQILASAPSGDWTLASHYYFRPTGTLAFLFAELRTFHGNVKAETRWYYDSAGKRIRQLETLYDLSSGRAMQKADFERQDIPVYMTVKDLVKELGPDNVLEKAAPGH